MEQTVTEHLNELISELAKDAARAARDAGYDEQSYAFKSYLRGCFQVIASKHPEIAPWRTQFLQAAGVPNAKA